MMKNQIHQKISVVYNIKLDKTIMMIDIRYSNVKYILKGL